MEINAEFVGFLVIIGFLIIALLGIGGRRRRRRHRRRRGHPTPRRYQRATAVVANQGHILLVKHNRQNDWALPGGYIRAAEDPSRRAALEVAEETGILIDNPQFVGRYAGTVASHEIFIAQGQGQPRANSRELQDACWWDGTQPLRVQQHVNAILVIVRNWMRENYPRISTRADRAHIPALQHFIDRLPEPSSNGPEQR